MCALLKARSLILEAAHETFFKFIISQYIDEDGLDTESPFAASFSIDLLDLRENALK